MPNVFPPVVPASIFAGFLVMFSPVSQAATFTAAMVDQNGKPLNDVVLTLKGPPSKPVLAPKADMDQRDKEFVPHVLAVHTGTLIRFPNSDNIRHQVYSFSAPKRFELRLYEGTPSDPLLFDKPGVVVLGCNIHDWMLGYIFVTDDPWFGVSDDNGKLTLNDLPPGHYVATAWHPKIADMQPVPAGEFDVPAGGLQKSFTVAVQATSNQMPMAPAPSAFGDAFHKAAHE